MPTNPPEFAAKFTVMFLLMTILFSAAWVLLADKLYNCTDASGFEYWLDYLVPGCWVHGNYATVPVVTHNHSMSEPDTIKEGWGLTGLWLLWSFFFGSTLLISFSVAQIRRSPELPPPENN